MFDAFKKEDLENLKKLDIFIKENNINIDSLKKMIKEEKFRIRDLQNLFTIMDLLKLKEIEYNNLGDIIDDYIKESIEKMKIEYTKKKFPKCPECETGILSPVAGNDKGGEGVWACRKCRYSKYDGRTIEEMNKDLIITGE